MTLWRLPSRTSLSKKAPCAGLKSLCRVGVDRPERQQVRVCSVGESEHLILARRLDPALARWRFPHGGSSARLRCRATPCVCLPRTCVMLDLAARWVSLTVMKRNRHSPLAATRRGRRPRPIPGGAMSDRCCAAEALPAAGPNSGCRFSGNALHPDRMAAAERLAEIGSILALGILRLRAREVAARSLAAGDLAARNLARLVSADRDRRAPDQAVGGSSAQSTALSADHGESSLRFPPGQSGRGAPATRCEETR